MKDLIGIKATYQKEIWAKAFKKICKPILYKMLDT